MAAALIITGLVALMAAGVAVRRELVHRRALSELRGELAAADAKIAERSGLATVGEMVSGLAQELKTPLQEVLGNTELMLATSIGTGGHSQSTEDLQQIREGVERAAGIVRDLVAFTETVSLSRRWHDVSEIVDRAIDASRHDLGAHGIRVERESIPRLPMVYVDGRQLEKVLAALMTRAARGAESAALPGHVTVKIAVARVSKPDDHVVFTIDDNGAVPAGEAPGSASLAASRRVVDAHGGSLAVRGMTPGPGVRATIELPIGGTATPPPTAQEKPRSWTESSISSTSIAKSTSRS